MAKLKTISLVLTNNKQIDIPIWSKKAEDGKKCHIDRITNYNEVKQIKLYFFDDRTKVYDVLDTHVRKHYKRRK